MSHGAVLGMAEGRLAVLEAALGAAPPVPVGILLADPATDRLYVRLRRDFGRIAAPGDAEVLEALGADLEARARELGAAQLLAYLETTLSNTLRISDPQPVTVGDFPRAAERLYRERVPATVARYETHVPFYAAAVAAGPFLENPEVEERDWIEAPPGQRLSEGMFAVRIHGRSMEPHIPDGSVCLFRPVTGSRNGKLVLVRDVTTGGNEAFTVKRYRSEKGAREDGWRHEKITLEPLNLAFAAWDLDPEEHRYRILGEFVAVLD
jgi:SOS-response transcriptional repressor LexA